MNEQYLITYLPHGKEPKTFFISKEQYNLELEYQIKLAEHNPNKATADYAEELIDGYLRKVEVISFYDPDDADYVELQLVRIDTVMRG